MNLTPPSQSTWESMISVTLGTSGWLLGTVSTNFRDFQDYAVGVLSLVILATAAATGILAFYHKWKGK